MSIFTVVSTHNGWPLAIDQHQLPRWASGLIATHPNDLAWAVDQDGAPLLTDSCGNYRYPPEGMFRVVWSEQ